MFIRTDARLNENKSTIEESKWIYSEKNTSFFLLLCFVFVSGWKATTTIRHTQHSVRVNIFFNTLTKSSGDEIHEIIFIKTSWNSCVWMVLKMVTFFFSYTYFILILLLLLLAVLKRRLCRVSLCVHI